MAGRFAEYHSQYLDFVPGAPLHWQPAAELVIGMQVAVGRNKESAEPLVHRLQHLHQCMGRHHAHTAWPQAAMTLVTQAAFWQQAACACHMTVSCEPLETKHVCTRTTQPHSRHTSMRAHSHRLQVIQLAPLHRQAASQLVVISPPAGSRAGSEQQWGSVQSTIQLAHCWEVPSNVLSNP